MSAQAFTLIAGGDAGWLSDDVPSILGRPARSYLQFADYAPTADWCYVATRPPSTARVTPWTKLASSLARKTIAAASSSG